MKIAFFDTKPYDKKSFDEENTNFNFDISYFDSKLTGQTVSLTHGFDVVCAFVNDTLSSGVLEALKQNGIKLIAMRCAGYNNVDLKKAYKNVHVVRVPAYSPYAVAEHAVAMMLTLNRKTHKAYSRTRDNNFSINGFLGFDMHGKTAGIIGTGKIGQKIMSILNGFGMEVLAYDKFPKNDLEKSLDFEYTELASLYLQSDIISLHCPLNAETRHIISKKSIEKMKDGVMIINTSRGGLIDTQALLDNLKTGKIGAAGLDVYEEESDYFFEDFSSQILTDDVLARLLTFPNVLITSHQAFFTKEALGNIAETTLHNIKDYFEKDKLPNEICYRCDSDSCLKEKLGRCF
ncbi:MAG: 2-hydroxyacid dehydrogenase [Spirochaetales bacterium]|nr:2-hydroxyacid dehydrogenase [Spirochaetales bacterium]